MTAPVPKTIFHYTSASALPSIIQPNGEASLYATHSNYLNDSNELSTGISLVKDILKNRPEILKLPDDRLGYLEIYFNAANTLEEHEGYFLTCFSETTGIVDQWRGYGNSGYGFALGFNYLDIVEFSSKFNNVHFLKCVYDQDKQIELIVNSAEKANSEYGERSAQLGITDGFLSKALNNFTFANTILESTLRIKHEAFMQEREWRLVIKHSFINPPNNQSDDHVTELKFRSAARGLIPYLSLGLPKLENIIVGPSPDQTGNFKAAGMLLKSSCLKREHGIEITSENIPYRD